MRTRTLAVVAVALTLFVGCSGSPPAKSDPIEVTVSVTLPKGQPASNLQLMLLPSSSSQLQGGGKTDASGKVKTKLTPGKYTYSFDGNPAAAPKKYHTNSADHSVEVTSTTTELEIKLTD